MKPSSDNDAPAPAIVAFLKPGEGEAPKASAEGVSLASDRQSVPLLHQALVAAGFFDRARVEGAPAGWFDCAGDKEAFVRQWGGATLRTIDGRDASSASGLRAAAQSGAGARIPTTWDVVWANATATISVATLVRSTCARMASCCGARVASGH
jgi:hypothetical protein